MDQYHESLLSSGSVTYYELLFRHFTDLLTEFNEYWNYISCKYFDENKLQECYCQFKGPLSIVLQHWNNRVIYLEKDDFWK